MICRRVKAGRNAMRFDVKCCRAEVRMIKEGRQPGVCSREWLVIEPGSYGKRKGMVEEKWGAVKAALCETADAVLGLK